MRLRAPKYRQETQSGKMREPRERSTLRWRANGGTLRREGSFFQVHWRPILPEVHFRLSARESPVCAIAAAKSTQALSRLENASGLREATGLSLHWHCHAAFGFRHSRQPVSQADDENQLCRIPVPARGHSPSDMALPPAHPQLARGRRFVGATRSGGILRDSLALGE